MSAIFDAIIGKLRSSDPPDNSKLGASEKGVPGWIATLDESGKVPSLQLPSYVDDVVEYASQAAFPVTGETGKIYVALDTNVSYRWSGSAYVAVGEQTAAMVPWSDASGFTEIKTFTTDDRASDGWTADGNTYVADGFMRQTNPTDSISSIYKTYGTELPIGASIEASYRFDYIGNGRTTTYQGIEIQMSGGWKVWCGFLPKIGGEDSGSQLSVMGWAAADVSNYYSGWYRNYLGFGSATCTAKITRTGADTYLCEATIAGTPYSTTVTKSGTPNKYVVSVAGSPFQALPPYPAPYSQNVDSVTASAPKFTNATNVDVAIADIISKLKAHGIS